METNIIIAHIGYLISISCFIIGIKRLGKVKTCRSANLLAASAMLIAIVSQLIELGTVDYKLIAVGLILGSLVGVYLARTVQMTEMPELVAIFNGLGGGASTFVALSLFFGATSYGLINEMDFQGAGGFTTALTIIISIFIGSITFSGSIIAYAKLSGKFGRSFDQPILLPARHLILLSLVVALIILSWFWFSFASTGTSSIIVLLLVTLTSLIIGVMTVIAIGGADMPVVISLLNSYSGIAAAATGFTLQSPILIVSGSLVGASGIILTKIMCKGMNRSLTNVVFGGFGVVDSSSTGETEYKNVKSTDPEDAALDFEIAQKVVIVPGYGLAVAQGQNIVAEFAKILQKNNCDVRFAIHPVAGRMPGHMNVLLAEANIPYENLYEMDEINDYFKEVDIVLVVGANDVVNPAAKEDKSSPLYGMPVLNVEDAKIVFVIKRSLSPGFAGVKNTLFEKDNCRMIYGDAKKVVEEINGHLLGK